MKFRDPTHGGSEPTRYWTTVNIGEAMPDVLSPMCWSFWGPGLEAAARLAYYDFGILSKGELGVPTDPNELLVSYFFGRPAMNMDLLRVLFGAMPGMTADDFERDICGEVRPGLPPVPSRGRTPYVLAKSPKGMATAGRGLRAYAGDQRAWWEREVLDGKGLDDPRRLLTESEARFREAFRRHVHGRFVLMPVQAQLTRLAQGAGRTDLINRVMGGLGGVTETELADDLWQVGRGILDTGQFLRRYGFHGPNEGNLDSSSWREDDTLLQQMAKAMADRPESQRPRTREAAMMQARRVAVSELVGVLPRPKQALARVLCKAAVRTVQGNEIGKASFLMALDGGRAATRAIGRRLHGDGRLEDAEDAFYLTMDELLAPLPADVKALVQFRRERRQEYRGYELPVTFTGVPEVAITGAGPAEVREGDGAGDGDVVGVAGAPGAVEGRARVVIDPDVAELLEPGDILVCRFTDPSWAPLFTLAEALVIDIGAAASHGAIVARELGVPCVIGTGDGTRRIRVGDRIRVDGSAGRVQILERAPAGTAPVDADGTARP